jgi:hypothetical protein
MITVLEEFAKRDNRAQIDDLFATSWAARNVKPDFRNAVLAALVFYGFYCDFSDPRIIDVCVKQFAVHSIFDSKWFTDELLKNTAFAITFVNEFFLQKHALDLSLANRVVPREEAQEQEEQQ